MTDASIQQRQGSSMPMVLVAFGAGAAVTILLGTYARVHDPTGETVMTAIFSGQLQFKVWVATLAMLFAVAQVISALRMYGKFRTPAPPWLGDVHRLTGTLAFLFTLPIAYHCLWSLGYSLDLEFGRVFIHSVAGCLFYGAFVVKVLAVRFGRQLGWALPWVGGTLFVLLVLLWFTSSFWVLTGQSPFGDGPLV